MATKKKKAVAPKAAKAKVTKTGRSRAAPTTAEAHRREGDRFFKATPPDLVKALACYRAGADLGDDDSAKNAVYIMRQYEEVLDVSAAERLLEAMADRGRAWASAQLAQINAARSVDRLRPTRLAMHDAEKIGELCERFQLTAHKERLLAVARPSVLLLGRAANEKRLPIGATKLGGDPDVARGFVWPLRGDRPLTFLGQVNVAAMQRLVPDPALPASGLLSFFYDAKEQPWGAPNERDAWAIHFAPDVKKLTRQRSPAAAEPFATFSLEVSRELTLPFMRTAIARELSLGEADWKRYGELYSAHQRDYCVQPAPKGDVHRFLGHPDALQGDMTRRIEYGLHDADIEKADPALDAAAKRWRLLFQVGSDFNQNMNWGDNGRLFFWIRDEDLARSAFAEAYVQLQSH